MPDKKQTTPPTAEELNAYLDGALGPDRLSGIESYLARNPSGAARLDTYRQQDTTMRAVFDAPHPDDPPEEIRTLAAKLSRTVDRHRRIRSAARHTFVVVLCLAAAAVGRFTAEFPAATDQEVFAQSRFAADAFRLVTDNPGASGLDQSATPAELGGVLTGDGDKVRIPRLQLLGFTLVGGQLLPTGAGPAVQLVYNDEKKGPFSLYVARAPECGRTTPRFTRDDDVSLLSWCKDRVVYMLIGRLDRESMRWIMESVTHSGSPTDERPQEQLREPEPAEQTQPQLQPAVAREAPGN
jgi:anti-sigma factor RsiW